MSADPRSVDPTPLSPTASREVGWLALVSVVVAMLLTAAWFLLRHDPGPYPPFIDPARVLPPATAPSSEPSGALRLAGSGSNLPITRTLAAAYARHASSRPIVHASIGSGGGIRALHDGVIDIALVSRDLRPEERDEDFVITPYARVPVMVAVNVSVPERSISSDELLAIYRGTKTRWSDGTRIVVLQREQGDSSHGTVGAVLPEFAAINEAAYREGRWRVLYQDATMEDALESTAGAIGLYGTGAIASPESSRALEMDGVAPTVENLVSGAYPFAKDLGFVTRGEPFGEARAFLDFVHSPEGQRIIGSYGCAPLGRDGELLR